MKRDDKPREYPETEEGQAAFDRFRDLTRRLMHVPKETVAKRVRERKEDS